MKVLIAIPCLLTGGTEIKTLNLVRALIQGGHQVTTACYFEHTENMVKLYEEAGDVYKRQALYFYYTSYALFKHG